MADPRDGLVPFLEDLLTRWASGDLGPADVIRSARQRWEPYAWPQLPDDDPNGVPATVLWMLAFARQLGIVSDDVPWLRDGLRNPRGGVWSVLERALETIDLETRAARQVDGYDGAATDDSIDDAEMSIWDPEERRLHRLVREDPEAVWLDVRARICEQPDDFAQDLIDDLVWHHAEAFVDRLIALADECPGARAAIELLYTGDWPNTPAADRFAEFADRLQAR